MLFCMGCHGAEAQGVAGKIPFPAVTCISVNEEVGLMIDGFDSRPVLMSPYDPPYAGSRVDGCGYAKIKDVFSYDYDVQNAPETIGAKLLARAGMPVDNREKTSRSEGARTARANLR